ncbi:hypothetical protein [Peribacillus sp. SCS-155]|uniref:hypothetical protein n=1 Tax=Peribacillus sedimenti TaxID=3115297 RepID=UPI003905B8AF
MSAEHLKKMLKTLSEYPNSEITLTFNNRYEVPILSVNYLKLGFHLTYLNNQTVETYYDIETTVTAINIAIENNLQTTSK